MIIGSVRDLKIVIVFPTPALFLIRDEMWSVSWTKVSDTRFLGANLDPGKFPNLFCVQVSGREKQILPGHKAIKKVSEYFKNWMMEKGKSFASYEVSGLGLKLTPDVAQNSVSNAKSKHFFFFVGHNSVGLTKLFQSFLPSLKLYPHNSCLVKTHAFLPCKIWEEEEFFVQLSENWTLRHNCGFHICTFNSEVPSL